MSIESITKKVVLGTLCLLAFAAQGASASAATPAGSIDLTEVKAKTVVKDTLLPAGARIAVSPKAVASESFTDTSGNSFSIDTAVPGYDLNQPANVLNSTVHKSEIRKLSVHVITLSQMTQTCGNNQAVACYRAMAGGYGELWYAADDDDWVHSLVHEYGHHIDNQLANIAQLKAYGYGKGCTTSSDGSRDWFFLRISGSNTTDANKFYCSGTDWEHLLPELYAEDFVVLNGIVGWQLSSAQPPDADQLKGLEYDINNKLLTATDRKTRRIRHGRSFTRHFSTPFFNLLRVRVTGDRGSNFDIYLHEMKKKRIWKKATRSGRSETMTVFVAPGYWDVVIRARGATAKARIELRLL
jgi:hypothetical protein